MKSFLEEHHYHIIYNLQVSWGTARGRDYINSLMLVEQGNTRQGFSAEAFSEVQMLLNIHDEVFPQFYPFKDIWGEQRSRERNTNFWILN